MGKQSTQSLWKLLLLALSLTLFCSGCASWRRSSVTKELPKEIPVSAPLPEEVPLPEEGQLSPLTPAEPGATALAPQTSTTQYSKQTAELTARAGNAQWHTSDEMTARYFAELLNLKQERFQEELDLREYDYLATITEKAETKTEQEKIICYELWINFEKENEIIVKNRAGDQWNLSIRDSNALRSLVRRQLLGE